MAVQTTPLEITVEIPSGLLTRFFRRTKISSNGEIIKGLERDEKREFKHGCTPIYIDGVATGHYILRISHMIDKTLKRYYVLE